VMKARNLNEAIDLVNATGYGLTSGLESLDDREQRLWLEGIRAGNLYVNRPTTGAVVLRQPFGGMGKSAFGPGVKAGGPNYVALLMDHEETGSEPAHDELHDPASESAQPAEDQSKVSLIFEVGSPTATLSHQPPAEEHLAPLAEALGGLAESDSSWPADQLLRVVAAIASYQRYMQEEFGRSHDHFKLIGEDNIRRYLPVPELRVRFSDGDSLFELFARVCAARAAGCRTTVSYSPDRHDAASLRLLDELTHDWGGAIELVEETDDRLAEVIHQRQTDRVRYAAADRVSPVARLAAADNQIYLADAPVLVDGRIELLWYVREQSLSLSYHRYGNLGMRADQPRAPTM